MVWPLSLVEPRTPGMTPLRSRVIDAVGELLLWAGSLVCKLTVCGTPEHFVSASLVFGADLLIVLGFRERPRKPYPDDGRSD